MRRLFHIKMLGCFVAVCFMLMANCAHAQTSKGMMVIGGNADISELLQGKNTNFNFALQPNFGVFVVNNFALGGLYSLTAGSSRGLNPDGSYTTATALTTLVGPFLKYYFGKKPMKPFIAASGGYSVYTLIVSNTGSSGTGLANFDGFSVNGAVGIAYFFNPHVSIESSLYINASGYQTQLPTQRFGLSLGVYAFLDKKKTE